MMAFFHFNSASVIGWSLRVISLGRKKRNFDLSFLRFAKTFQIHFSYYADKTNRISDKNLWQVLADFRSNKKYFHQFNLYKYKHGLKTTFFYRNSIITWIKLVILRSYDGFFSLLFSTNVRESENIFSKYKLIF